MIRDLDGRLVRHPHPRAPRMSATVEAEIDAAIERGSRRVVRAIRHERMALRTAQAAAPKVCRGCGEEIPARDCVNVNVGMWPRWMCRSCAWEEEPR